MATGLGFSLGVPLGSPCECSGLVCAAVLKVIATPLVVVAATEGHHALDLDNHEDASLNKLTASNRLLLRVKLIKPE